MIKPKGLKEILAEDPSLTEEITYEEFVRRQQTTATIKDDGVEEAYNAYCKVLEELNGE